MQKRYQKRYYIRAITGICVLLFVLALIPQPIMAGEIPVITAVAVTAQQGRICTVQINGEHLDDLRTVKLTVFFDPDAFTYDSCSYPGMDMGSANANTQGQVQLGAMSMDGVSGSQLLMELKLKVDANAQNKSYPLILMVEEATCGTSYAPVELHVENGAITVVEYQAMQAYFYLNSDYYTVEEGQSISVELHSWDLAGMTAYESLVMLPAMEREGASLSVNAKNEGQVVAAYMALEQPETGALLRLTLTARKATTTPTPITCTPLSVTDAVYNTLHASPCAVEVSVFEGPEQQNLPDVWMMGPETLENMEPFALTVMAEGRSNLAAADFSISYDTALLECLSVTEMETEGVMVVTNESIGNGTIRFSMVAAKGISKDTALITIQMRPKTSSFVQTQVSISADEAVDADRKIIELEYVPCIITYTKIMQSGNNVTLQAPAVEAGTNVVIAGYLRNGQMVDCAHVTWADKHTESVTLKNGKSATKIRVFFLDSQWNPMRTCLTES